MIASRSIISIAAGVIPAAMMPRDRLARIAHAVERGENGLRGLGDADDPQHHLGHDAERALAADDDAEEVVARSVSNSASEPRDASVRR